MSRKTAIRLAQLEQMIRDLEPADPAWQAAAAEYEQLKRQQRTSEHGVIISDKNSSPAEYVHPAAPWEK